MVISRHDLMVSAWIEDGQTLRTSIAWFRARVKFLLHQMRQRGISYRSVVKGVGRSRGCGPLATLLADQVFQFTEESLHILEIAVDGGEADVGDLVEGEEALGEQFSYF